MQHGAPPLSHLSMFLCVCVILLAAVHITTDLNKAPVEAINHLSLIHCTLRPHPLPASHKRKLKDILKRKRNLIRIIMVEAVLSSLSGKNISSGARAPP